MPPKIANRCFAKGCHADAGQGRLMCLDHWRMVPADLQREVNRTNAAGERSAWARAATRAQKSVQAKEASSG